ncbi:MAG: twin-arginine translocation signal domain-containing protein, partial [Acidobacteriales bacterium]
MKSENNLSRRSVVKNTLAALAGAAGASEALLAQKKPGETRVLFL